MGGRQVASVAAALSAALVSLTLGAAVVLGAPAKAITATEGVQFTGVVDQISCTQGSPPQNISIDWGDGTAASGGTGSVNGGSCTISGSHTYAEEGSYTTTITYVSAIGTPMNTDVGSATVSDAQPSANSGDAISVAAGTAFTAVVATFSDPAPEPLANYSATIDWGDGTSSPGSVGSGFTVSGTHTYANGGTYAITATIKDEGGATATPHDTATVSGCPGVVPNGPAPSFEPTVADLNARYVQALFHDLLGRTPASNDPALVGLTNALGHGETREQLASYVLTAREYRSGLVNGYYAALLRHAPDPTALNFWTGALNGGATDEGVLAQILGSDEYFAGRANSSNDAFLAAVYCDVLSRVIDQPTQNGDGSALATGTTRGQVVSGVLASGEYRSKLVNGFYLRFLRRAADSPSLAFFSNLIQGGGTDEKAIAAIVSSPEYYALFNPAVTVVTTLTAKGEVHTTIPRAAKLALTVLKVVPPPHPVRAAAFGAPSTKVVGVVKFGRHRKGRVTIHWNRKVGGKRLRRGSYIVLLRALSGRKLIYVSDALPFKVR